MYSLSFIKLCIQPCSIIFFGCKKYFSKRAGGSCGRAGKKTSACKEKDRAFCKKKHLFFKKGGIFGQNCFCQKINGFCQKTESAQKKPAVENTASSAAQNAVVKTSVSEKTAAKPSVKDQSHLASAVVPQKPVEELPDRKFNIPKAAPGAKIAFVIDDAGQSVSNLKKYTSLPFDISVAVLPGLSHTKDCAYVVRAAKKELLLHQPMQAENLNLDPGPCAIKPDMSTFEIAQIVKTNLDELGPGVKGMNNHEGSLITGNVIKIGAVLDVAAERGIYFLDSRTTAASMARQAALERDMNIKERDVFIDDIVNRDKMLEQIYRGIGIANKKGKVIMIGHVDKSAGILPQLLSELYPYLKKNGYTVTVPSRL